MKRFARSGALRRRYGRSLYGVPSAQRHSYREALVAIENNPGSTPWMLRHWGQQRGTHKAVTARVLQVAERRGHVEMRGGRVYLTPRGFAAAFGGA